MRPEVGLVNSFLMIEYATIKIAFDIANLARNYFVVVSVYQN